MIQIVPRRGSPQEKKDLSYERDRRNVYGENDKASRKGIPRSKRTAAQAYRKRTKQLIGQLTPGEDSEEVEARVGDLRRTGTGVSTAWRKIPDMPLGEWLRRKKRS
jgi:hypothetical protein